MDLPTYHVEIRMRGRTVVALSVPNLDCVRVPALTTPVMLNWRKNGTGRWRAEFNAVIGSPGDHVIEQFEFLARRVS